jgi:hypothetical protein
MKKILNRILPLLNEYIPEEIAMKGIGKISPQMGSFLQKGLSAGLPLAGGLAFLKDQLSGSNSDQNIDRSLRPDEQAALSRVSQAQNENQRLKGAAKLGLGLAGGLGAGGLASSALGAMMGNEEEMPSQPQQQQNIIAQYSPELHEFLESEINKGRSHLEAGALSKISGKFNKIISKMEKDLGLKYSEILDSIYGKMASQQVEPQQQSNQGLDPALMDIMNKIRSGMQKLQGG